MSLAATDSPPLVLQLGPLSEKLNDDEFFDFCQLNRDLRLERTREGELLIMAPTGGETSSIEFNLGGAFWAWAQADGTGVGFGPSGGFRLPNGATRAPGPAWVTRPRWEALSKKQRERFPPLCPDFVAEVRSPKDSLPALEAKMQEWIDNGARLGWLIDPLRRHVAVYRPGEEVVHLDQPQAVSGDPVLPGFTLELRRVW